jgi:ribosomal protein S18 acetylase RimI-like enzyme
VQLRVRKASSETDLNVVRELLIDYLLLPDAWAPRDRRPQQLKDLPASLRREVQELPGTALLAESAPTDAAGIVFLSPFVSPDHSVASNLASNRGRCEMKRLYVRPEARGKGLGRELAEAAIAAARSGGQRAILLDALPTRVQAIRLYESLGFRPVRPFRRYPVDMIFMSMEL